MTKEIILVCGVQGSGKSWVCQQLKEKYHYIPHDRCWRHSDITPEEMPTAGWGPPGSKSIHLECLVGAASSSDVPIITEVPFGERFLRFQLEFEGFHVICVFIVEDVELLKERFFSREYKPLPQSAITRALGLKKRAIDWECFCGTSDEVLSHLLDIDAAHKVKGIEYEL